MTSQRQKTWLSLAAGALLLVTAQAQATATFFEHEGFRGQSFSTDQAAPNFERRELGSRASSVVVTDGPWEVCDEPRFGGRCEVLRPGRHSNLATIGMNDRIRSARRVEVAQNAAPSITFYDQERFAGRTFTTEQTVGNLEREGYNDRASSVVVKGGASWEVCSDPRFGGRCNVLRPGDYASLVQMGLNDRISSVRRADGPPETPPPVAVVPSATFYEQEAFRGRSFSTEQAVPNFDRQGFNARAASADVVGDTFEVCEDPRFGGRCALLRPGRYPSIASMGLSDRVASVRGTGPEAQRVVAIDRSPSPPPPPYDARRRGEERLFQANVTSVRAVVANADQRCWVEREQVAQPGRPNVGGAIAGAVIGGILGHQVGGGSGRDIATAGGAIAGAAVGANVNRDRAGGTQDVQRCSTVDNRARPEYWDVTYNFRGMEHRVQMNSPPQATVTVNEQGEPRI